MEGNQDRVQYTKLSKDKARVGTNNDYSAFIILMGTVPYKITTMKSNLSSSQHYSVVCWQRGMMIEANDIGEQVATAFIFDLNMRTYQAVCSYFSENCQGRVFKQWRETNPIIGRL